MATAILFRTAAIPDPGSPDDSHDSVPAQPPHSRRPLTDMVETHVFLLQLLAILLTARLLGELATAIRIPAVIGELTAGILLGPSLLGWVETSNVILILAEIGVILLLFEVGLETELDKLMDAGRKAVVVAVGGFIVPFLLGFWATYYLFQQSLIVSLFVGGTITATSIGITVRTLVDVRRQNSPEGQITLGAAVLDDVFGVVLLALLFEFSITGAVNWINAARVLGFISVFFLAAPCSPGSFPARSITSISASTIPAWCR